MRGSVGDGLWLLIMKRTHPPLQSAAGLERTWAQCSRWQKYSLCCVLLCLMTQLEPRGVPHNDVSSIQGPLYLDSKRDYSIEQKCMISLATQGLSFG
jgi:hypothetical protein